MRGSGHTCSVAELGELLDLSPRRLQQLAKEGIIPKDVRGRYDLAGAVHGYSRYLQDQPARDGEDPDLLQAKTTTEILKVQERRARVGLMKKSLINRARATDLVHHLGREARDSWANWPSRVAALMAAELGVDAAAMQISLENHVREHFQELSEIRSEFR